MLDINGVRISAQSQAPLSAGQTLQLQTISSSPQVELQIVSSPQQQFFGRSLTLIGENVSLGGLIETLGQNGASPLQGQTTANVLAAKGNGVYTVDIGGRQIEIQSNIPLDPGQSLQIQMDPHPQTQLSLIVTDPQQISGTSLTLVGDSTDQAGPLMPPLQPGASSLQSPVQATVVGDNGQGVYTLDIGGNRFQVWSGTALTPGQSLQLQVETSPLPQLHIVANAQQQAAGGTLTLVGQTAADIWTILQQSGPPPLESLNAATQATLTDFYALQQNKLTGTDSGQVLKQLVDKIGLTLENQLAKGDSEGAAKTLKAALFEVAYVFKDSAGISEATHRLLGTLEVYQLAQQHLENTGSFITPLPLPFIKQGYLTVDDYGRQQKGTSTDTKYPLSFSLHLTLSDLGNLRIEFLQYQDGLYIRFNTESKDKSDFVSSLSGELKQSISTVPLLGLTFSESATDPTTELIQKLLPQGTSILDTTA